MSYEVCEVCICDNVKAKKTHVCAECYGQITKGEIYCKYHGVFDGSGFTVKTCVDCDALRKEVDADSINDPDNGTAFEYLHESVFESYDVEWMRKFLDIKRKRGGPVEQWMIDRLEEYEQRNHQKNQ